MTPDDIRVAREAIGWSQQALADQLGTTATQVQKWERGKVRMRPGLLGWLQRLAGFHVANPPPSAPVYVPRISAQFVDLTKEDEYPTRDE
jgi:transcriptional regulator with XRE-family HTH domain